MIDPRIRRRAGRRPEAGRVLLRPAGPYSLALSLRAASRFLPDGAEEPGAYRAAVHLGGRPSLMEVRDRGRRPPEIEVGFSPGSSPAAMRELAAWILHTDLDLRPFYRAARGHPVLGPMIRPLLGLVAFRMPSVFVMAVTAVTEQQISLVAAYRIRQRLVERYGERLDGRWAFPTPEALARARVPGLRRCGLSGRKAEYIIGLARGTVSGDIDLDGLQSLSDEDARAYCMRIRGIGPWAADYILIRGLGRVDVVPADDLGLQKLVGHYLGQGKRLTPREVRRAMEPFAPFRGLAVFYMMVYRRLMEPTPQKS